LPQNAASIANSKLHNQTNLALPIAMVTETFFFENKLADDQNFLKKIWLTPQKLKTLF
jgi:hypothetical protein